MNYENQEIWSFKSYKFILSSFFLILTLSIFFSCKTDTQLNQNNLNLESSPYLLQHAQNPVHWQSWNENLYSKYYPEKKLIVVSIGYSSCHWCHVMEKESFKDEAVARYMNKHFINIKVDREENPEVDQLYMTATQMMTGSGGWPLNVVCLPSSIQLFTRTKK